MTVRVANIFSILLLCIAVVVLLLSSKSHQDVLKPIARTMLSAGGASSDYLYGPYYDAGESFYYNIMYGHPGSTIYFSNGETFATNNKYYLIIIMKMVANDSTFSSKILLSDAPIILTGASIKGSSLVFVANNMGSVTLDSVSVTSTPGSILGFVSAFSLMTLSATTSSSYKLEWRDSTLSSNTLYSVGSVDNSGGSTITYTGTSTSSFTLQSGSGLVAIVSLFSSSLSHLMSTVLPSSSTGISATTGVAVGASGPGSMFYVCGYFTNTITFSISNGGNTNLNSKGSADVFILLLDKNPSSVVVKLAFSSAGISSDTFDEPLDILVVPKSDPKDYVYIVGYQSSSDKITLTNTGTKAKAGFVALYQVDKNFPSLATIAEKIFSGDILFTSMFISGSELFVTGYFSGTVTIGSSKLTSAGGYDILLACFDSETLNPKWAYGDGGVSNEYALKISMKSSYLWVSGMMPPDSKFKFFGVTRPAQSQNEDGFMIGYGDPFYCYNTACNNDSVCSGHGTCGRISDTTGNCTCATGYSDYQCGTFYCFGKLLNDTNVCSGRGSCIAPDTCTCNSGYGSECQLPTCFGVKSNDTSVCNGHGTCIDYDTCTCSSSYGGSTCSIPTCFGIVASNSSACSGYPCVSVDTCNCPQNRRKSDCSELVEFTKYSASLIASGSPIKAASVLNSFYTAYTFGGGYLYFYDEMAHKIVKATEDGEVIGNIVGSSKIPTSIDISTDPLQADISASNLQVSSSNELYFTNFVSNQNYLHKLSSSGLIQKVIGVSPAPVCTNGVGAVSCSFSPLITYTFDSSYTLYVASENCVKQINLLTGIITDLFGVCEDSLSLIMGAYPNARINSIYSMIYFNGNLYFVHRNRACVTKYDLTQKTLSQYAGTCGNPSPADDGLDFPLSIAFNPTGTKLYIALQTKLKVFDGRAISVVNSVGDQGGMDIPEGAPIINAKFNTLNSLLFKGNDLFLINEKRIKKVSNSKVYAVVGGATWKDEGNPIKFATLQNPQFISISNGSVYYVETPSASVTNVKKFDITTKIVSTLLHVTDSQFYLSLASNSNGDFFIGQSSQVVQYGSNGNKKASIGNSSPFRHCAMIQYQSGKVYCIDAVSKSLNYLDIATSTKGTITISGTINALYVSSSNVYSAILGRVYKYPFNIYTESDEFSLDYHTIGLAVDLFTDESNGDIYYFGATGEIYISSNNYIKTYIGYRMMKGRMENGQRKVYFYGVVGGVPKIVETDFQTSITYTGSHITFDFLQMLPISTSCIFVTKIQNPIIYLLNLSDSSAVPLVGSVSGYKDGPFEQALFIKPTYLAKKTENEIIVADVGNLRLINMTSRTVSTIKYGSMYDDAISSPTVLSKSANDELIIGDSALNSLSLVSGDQFSVLYAKTPSNDPNTVGLSVDSVVGACKDEFGNIFVSDNSSHVIRKYSNGTSSIIAGKLGVPGYSGDKLDASQALLNGPTEIRCLKGQILFIDFNNYAIRKITSNHTIHTVYNGNVTSFDILDNDVFNLIIADKVENKIQLLTGICEPGWIGKCDIWTCFGLSYTNQSVCSGAGSCLGVDSCQCNEGYRGNNCQKLPNCFGFNYTQTRAGCSFNGECEDRNLCSCDPGWIGSSCEIPTCSGILYNDSRVCSGHGSCKVANNCTCDVGWTGSNCSIPICYGFSGAMACNENGDCVSNNTCVCYEGWKGLNCSIPYCFGIPNDNSSRCSSHGECIEIDQCQCNYGYEGSNCELHMCYGKSKNASSVCSNQQGICTDANQCTCFTTQTGKTSGAECGEVKCLGSNNEWFDSNSSSVCSGHGSCQFNNSTNIECNCFIGYMGSYCQYPICFDIPSYETNQVCSGKGICSLHDTCVCESGWTGANCSIPICYGFSGNVSCNENGDCISNNTCVCYEGWKGLNCSIPYCFGIPNDNSSRCSSHGECIEIDQCQCNYGYEGSNCELHMCYGKSKNASSVCSNQQGICTDANQCTCFTTQTGKTSGAECGEVKCLGANNEWFDSNSSSVCSGHGLCQFNNSTNIECNCLIGYMGSYCQYPICFDIPSYETNQVCSGKGICSLHDTCVCKSGWTGANCSIPTCFGFAGRDGCNQNGQCVLNETCSCDSGWYGLNCSIPSCFGIPANFGTTCTSHGKCDAMDQCTCNYGYEGSKCEIHMCYGKSKNASSVCSNQQGICTDANQCTCFTTQTGKTSGAECGEVKCLGANNEWIDSLDARVCSGVGNCIYNSSTEIVCNCSSGYTGSYCQYPICYGIPSYSNQVCSGTGQCTSPNTCTCYNDDTRGHYKGKLCEKCKAPYSGSQCNYIEPCGNETKCHSHGYCDEYGFCSCFQDDLNGYFNGSTCNYCNNGYFGEDCLTQIQSDVSFSNNGDSLVFKLSYPPHFTSNIVNCSKLFDNSKLLFGTNPVCKYLNKASNDFVIELIQDHNLNVNDEILLNVNVFNRVSNDKSYISVKIRNATNPTLPFVITSNKNTFSKCENVVLDASDSYSLDRKFNSYKWEIVSSNLLTLLNDDSSKLTINYDSLNAGNHTFQVKVTSYILKVTNFKQVTIQKLDYLSPAISIDGSQLVQVTTSDIPIIIRKSVQLTSCLPSNTKPVITWEYLSGKGIEYQIDSYNDLKIVKFGDLTQTNHQFKVSVYLIGYEQLISSAIVNVQLSIRPLAVNLIIEELTPDYVTFEIEQVDPDLENVTFSRVWSFSNLVQSSYVLNYLNSNSNISIFTITKDLAQQSSQFDIYVQISKGSRSATSSISVSFPDSVSKIAPIVTLANEIPSNINKGTPYNMQLLVSGGGNHTSRSWTLNSQSIPDALASLNRVSLQNSNSIILNTDTFEEGSQNVVSFKITNLDSSLSSSIEGKFTINLSPKACSCQVIPSSGIALTTLFTFNCPSCQNEGKTYSFEYGFIDDYTGAPITLSKDEELYQKLPPSYYGNDLTLFVKVMDTITGASSTTYNKVTINLPSFKSVSEIQKLSKSWNQIASLLQSGDYKRGVFNVATISRTTTLMLKKLTQGRNQLDNEDQIAIQNILSELLNDFENTNQVKSQVGELTNSETIFKMLFGFDSIVANSANFNSTLSSTSLNVLNEIVNSARDSSGYVQIYLKSIFNSLYSYLSTLKNPNVELVNLSRKLGSLMLTNILIGQNPIKFETQFHLNYLNKHFKNELDSLRLESEIVNITLPSRISILIKTNSLKTPIHMIGLF